jgi:hypothetical protein
MLWISGYLWGLVVPEEKLQFERNLKRQARRLANLTGCKLTQAQRTLAIDVYGYKSLSDLKTAVADNTASENTLCLINFTNNVNCVTALRGAYEQIISALSHIEYLAAFNSHVVLATIFNLSSDELTVLVG